MTKLQTLADVLHSLRCHWNHTDGCSYLYESWDNIRSTRQSWLDKAQAMVDNGINVDIGILVLKAAKEAGCITENGKQ